MLQKPKGYEEVKEFTEFEQLEVGGHELIITKIEPVKGSFWQAIDIFFDTTKTDIQPGIISAKIIRRAVIISDSTDFFCQMKAKRTPTNRVTALVR